ncbi:MAG: immunoglobulin domain-containing protein [Sedimentisphaerales bacterium]|nr:immunoglobulin domain-containing protein [Sedimentisphaerales bacterium]MBN2843156.1 immunoglobulin domain-containing protein [Sedimentisphaerales bacterium]
MKKLLLSLAIAGMGTMASADLVHRYEFNGNANDSVGTAHGTLSTRADAGTIADGKLTTTGVSYGENVSGGVSLPATAVAGLNGPFSLETWFFAVAPQGDWHTIFSFDNGTKDNFIIGCPARGDGSWNASAHCKQAGVVDHILRNGAMDVWPENPDQGPRQMVVTYDGTTLRMYANGVLANVNNNVAAANFNLEAIATQLDINSGAPYGDPSLTGSTHDFRIYDHALTADEVAAIHAAGADASNNHLFPASAPTPAKNATMVGTVSGSTVDVELSWQTARNPVDLANPNPAAKVHYLYMNSVSDANVVLVDTITVTGATGSKSLTGLSLDTNYKWRVDQGMLQGNGTVSGPTEPNTVRGVEWNFNTMPSTPVITTQPVGGYIAAGGSLELSVVVSSITDVDYAWYYSQDTIIGDDVAVGTNSATYTIANATAEQQGYYYCNVNNDSQIVVSSGFAFVEVGQMVAHYSFDVTDEQQPSLVIDSSIQGNDGVARFFDGTDEVDSTVTYGTGFDGNGLVLAAGEMKHVEIPCSVRNSYTISAWVNTSMTAADGDWWFGAGIVDGEMSGWVPDYGIVLSGSKAAQGTGPSGKTIRSAKDINDGEWHYVVATRDINNGEIKIYVDGHREAMEVKDMGSVYTAIDVLNIGKVRDNHILEKYFVGTIDEVKIFNYAKDELTIAQEFVNMVPGDHKICIETVRPSGTYDLNGDCVVDVADFAILAAEWLDCGLYPACVQ